ncbi:MAG: Cytochrome peroxidase [Bacteroidota bacterium]|jgi:cytochrome c peroxidase
MLHKYLFLLLVIGTWLSISWQANPVSRKWPKAIQPHSNYASEAGFELGRALFYEPLLSKDSSISCASCHLSYTGFAHVDHPTSHGIENHIGRRNAPGLMNLKWRRFFHWDGGVLSLNGQAVNPLTHPDEMGSNLASVLQRLERHPTYRKAFQRIYKQSKLETWMLLDALQQFTSALISSESFYDKVSAGKYAFNPQQEKGALLFQEKCNTCHPAPLFSSDQFQTNQIDTFPTDLGRYEITGNPKDRYLFRVPSLRNVTHTYPYMHDGRFRTLKEVMAHYGKQFQLSDDAQKDLIAFLKTLTDTSFLHNKRFQYQTLTL